MFYSQKAFGVVGARPFGSYGRETRKKTAKSYAALRHEISLGPMKKIMPPSGRKAASISRVDPAFHLSPIVASVQDRMRRCGLRR
jgi:hypothetical protein